MDRDTKVRVWGLAACVFLTLGTYAMARPAVESLFLSVHGAQRLPWVWLGVAVGVVMVVTLYNRWAAETDLLRVYAISAFVSSLILAGLLILNQWNTPIAVFALYLWKDIYIVVLIETFWAQANSVVPETGAKRIYGWFCILGSLGGMAGNLVAGFLATTQGLGGTNMVLVYVAVLLLVTARMCKEVSRKAGEQRRKHKAPPSFRAGFDVLKNSRMLWLLMGLIATSQVVITLIDYQMNVALEVHYPQTDARTAVIGRIYAAIDLLAIGLQAATGPILRLLGVSAVLLAIPSLLGVAVAGFAVLPRFALMATSKVASKAFDYSLFRAAKEILYIPLSHEERTQGKALVDMCSYRVAKGACSLLLLGLVAWGSPGWVSIATLIIIGFWIVITIPLTRSHR